MAGPWRSTRDRTLALDMAKLLLCLRIFGRRPPLSSVKLFLRIAR